MVTYKRNQIEEAVARELEDADSDSTANLRVLIKRLIDTDRTLGRNVRSKDIELANFAFFSGDGPGKGSEIKFSEYDAFAIYLGVMLWQHRWPQEFVIKVLRRNRPELEKHHDRILKQDAGDLFDRRKLAAKAESGTYAFDNTDPVFLTIVSGRSLRHRVVEDLPTAVCRGLQQVAAFIRANRAMSHSITEIVGPAHRLSRQLANTEPRKRGRG